MSHASDPEYFVPCGHCGAVTRVSEEVHSRIGERGMRVGCHACGESMTIPPTRATRAAADRAKVDMGMFMIAHGEVERGRAILRDTEGGR